MKKLLRIEPPHMTSAAPCIAAIADFILTSNRFKLLGNRFV
jgi:hypothetical protein